MQRVLLILSIALGSGAPAEVALALAGAALLALAVSVVPPLCTTRRHQGSGSDLAEVDVASAPDLAQSIVALQDRILDADFDRQVKTLLITTAAPTRRKSLTAAHLALAHAGQGKRTLLVDGNFGNPSLHRTFGLETTAGLSNVLLGEIAWHRALVQVGSAANLHILSAGSALAAVPELSSSPVEELIAEMAHEYDLVIVDAPPVADSCRTKEMPLRADGVLIIARTGESSRTAIATVVNSLRRFNENVIGLVLNGSGRDSSERYYYYGYYGSHYHPSAARES